MPTEKRPNLFIVGAQKGGTSALSGWLSQHPQACMSFPKEPGYLAFGERGYDVYDAEGEPGPASKYVVRSEREYLALWADATNEQLVRGEASTWYLPTQGMAKKLYAYNAQAKIIVVLRNPAERAYSAYCHARADRVESAASFAQALALEAQRGKAEYLLRYHAMGLYAEALQSYQREFDESQLLVLFYEDLKNDPAKLWTEVCQFLGIETSYTPTFERKYNRSGQPRSSTIQRLMRSHRLKRTLRKVLPHRVALSIKEGIDNANLREFPALEADVRAQLTDYFRDDITKTSQLTGRNLDAWLQ